MLWCKRLHLSQGEEREGRPGTAWKPAGRGRAPRPGPSTSAPCTVPTSLLKEWPPDVAQRWHPSVLGAANWTPGKKEAFSGHKDPHNGRGCGSHEENRPVGLWRPPFLPQISPGSLPRPQQSPQAALPRAKALATCTTLHAHFATHTHGLSLWGLCHGNWPLSLGQ